MQPAPYRNIDCLFLRNVLIYFDNHRSMGTISYYVQQMFSTNRGDRLLPVKVVETRPPAVEEVAMSGSIGVGRAGFRPVAGQGPAQALGSLHRMGRPPRTAGPRSRWRANRESGP